MEQEKNKYYDLLKNESYKTMLNSEIQASVARDQALKYTQNAMNNNGYGSQGLSQTAYNGISNNYINALQNASATHQENLNTINQQQVQDQISANNDRFKTLTTYMSNVSNIDQLNEIMQNYGVGVDNGNLVYDDSKSSFLSDSDKQDLNAYYNVLKGNFENDYGNIALDNIDTASEIIKDNEGNYNTLLLPLDTLYKNTDKVESYIGKKFSDGDVMKISNGTQYAYLEYKNGQWYVSTKSKYISSNSKILFSGNMFDPNGNPSLNGYDVYYNGEKKN